jgi:hypothetical protein
VHQKTHIWSFFLTLITLVIMPALSFAQFPLVRISDPLSTDPEEVTIAIDPLNPSSLAAAANIQYYYSSSDAGHTWAQGILNSTLGVFGDPSMTFDAEGRLYFAHLGGFARTPSWLDQMVVQRSDNGGLTWNNGGGTAIDSPRMQDKEWIVADQTTSPYRNTLYMGWTQFDNYGSYAPMDSSRIMFASSTDQGATWSKPLRLDSHAGDCVDSDATVEGAQPAIGPNGEIYISWAAHNAIHFTRSLDGGKSFDTERTIASMPGGWAFEVPGIYRCNGLPTTLCDVSHSHNRGSVYIIWADQRAGVNNTDIFLIKSTDGGMNWSNAKLLNTDTVRSGGASSVAQQFFPSMTIDQTTGRLYGVFYDRREHIGDTTDVYLARSIDGGKSFENFKVSSEVFIPQKRIFFGDYIHIAAQNGRVYPIWMRSDTTALSIWTALVTDTLQSLVTPTQSLVTDLIVASSPTTAGSASLVLSLGESSNIDLSIYDVSGREVQEVVRGTFASGEYHFGWNGKNGAGSAMPSGMYFCRLHARAESNIATAPITLVRKVLLLR